MKKIKIINKFNSDNYINLYDKEYLLTVNAGGDEFIKSEISSRFTRILDLVPFYSKDTILDLGAGRGEIGLLLHNKVKEIILSDYSDEAIKIMSEYVLPKRNIKIEKINAKKIPYPDNYFDKIFFLEVIEHLYPTEAHLILDEIKRVLKRDGLLILSTEPNKYLSFPQYFIAEKLFQIKLKKYHLNEYSYFSLKKTIKKHFSSFKIYYHEERMWFFNVINSLKLPRIFKRLIFLLNLLYDINLFSYFRTKTFLNKFFSQSFLVVAKK